MAEASTEEDDDGTPAWLTSAVDALAARIYQEQAADHEASTGDESLQPRRRKKRRRGGAGGRLRLCVGILVLMLALALGLLWRQASIDHELDGAAASALSIVGVAQSGSLSLTTAFSTSDSSAKSFAVALSTTAGALKEAMLRGDVAARAAA